MPELLVAVEIGVHLVLLRLGLLKTQNVGLKRSDERVKQTFSLYGADPVDIP
jgi:hypothetical protein